MSKVALAVFTLAAVALPATAQAGEVGNRLGHQEYRIYQGVRDGQLSPREYERLQAGEARINDVRVEDLENHDGHLTYGEYRQLNRMENRQSNRIFWTKHDGPGR